LSGNLTSEYIFFGGARIARRDGSGNLFYYLADHLGSSREIIQAGQTTPCYEADFYPFGGERIAKDSQGNPINTCPQNYKFTGKERDPESGLDNFLARYYGSSIGRFMSADDPFVGWQLNDPQSLNLYAYVQDNPINDVDPTGHDGILPGQCFTSAPQKQVASGCPGGAGVFDTNLDCTLDPACGQLWGTSAISGAEFGDKPGVTATNNVETQAGAHINDTQTPKASDPCANDPDHCVHVTAPKNPPLPEPPFNRVTSALATFALQTKVFAQAIWRNAGDEFKQGGCSAAFVDAFAEGGSSHLKIPELPAGLGPDDAARAGAGALAADYAAKRALIVPLRSSIFRGILEFGEAGAATVSLADVYARIGEGVSSEARSALNGTCH